MLPQSPLLAFSWSGWRHPGFLQTHCSNERGHAHFWPEGGVVWLEYGYLWIQQERACGVVTSSSPSCLHTPLPAWVGQNGAFPFFPRGTTAGGCPQMAGHGTGPTPGTSWQETSPESHCHLQGPPCLPQMAPIRMPACVGCPTPA